MNLGELRYIELETSRLCNRVCPWCPNSITGSRRQQAFLPWPLLERALDALSKAQYQAWIALHSYNEPLANPRDWPGVAFSQVQVMAACVCSLEKEAHGVVRGPPLPRQRGERVLGRGPRLVVQQHLDRLPRLVQAAVEGPHPVQLLGRRE